jgi:PKD repeat protein
VLTDASTFDGAPLVGWQWDFGDGQGGYGTPVTHTYSETGSYSITLTITDGCGFSASTQVRNAVQVVEACTALTGVSISGATSGFPGTYTFTTSLEPGDATPLVTYLWDNGDTTATSVRVLDMGTHTLAVTATNCTDAVVTDSHTIVVGKRPAYIYLPLILRNR